MDKQQLFSALWEKYTQMTPSAKHIQQSFIDKGEKIINDHIAFRTFNDSRVNIDVLAQPFLEIGYVPMGDYEFKEKKLFAHHYQIPGDNTAPKIFISELILEKCSEQLQHIIKSTLDSIDYSKIDFKNLLIQGRLWDINLKDYEYLRDESEYASWMYIFGFCTNHFTIFVNYLKHFSTLQEVNELVKTIGYPLNTSGGEIKGSPEQLLEQSSTLADQIPIVFPEGELLIPSCYYEFAKRYSLPNGELYEGFIAASADKIFESTNVSLAGNAKKDVVMVKQMHKIIVAGAGGIGKAVALLLAEYADFDCEIYIGDINFFAAREAATWITKGQTNNRKVIPFHLNGNIEFEPDNIFNDASVLLDCLPGSEAPRMGKISLQYHLHYANLTEYVAESKQLAEMAKDAKTGFILQSGLAPGFINVLGNALYQKFTQLHNNPTIEYLGMKVGALTKNAQSPHYYGFTWSPIGVATEYLKEANVIKDFKQQSVKALSEKQNLIINGIAYEENFTSGGAADLPNAFEGIAKTLDYKTLRYPGHYHWVKQILKNVPADTSPISFLEAEMKQQIPLIEDDKVVIYATVKGFDQNGFLQCVEKAIELFPIQVGHVTLRAIQSSTAAALAECARMLINGNYTGVILQSQIDTAAFLNGLFVKRIYFPDVQNGKSSEPVITIAA